MIGKIFITSSGYDPEQGKYVKDPYLGDQPSLGACRPDVRRKVVEGDHIFTISGKLRGVPQYVMGGFEVAEKIDARLAYHRFPSQRLHTRTDGQRGGNIIVDADGTQHPLDNHQNFDRRIENYIVGKNPIHVASSTEIARGREQTLDVLCGIFDKAATSPFEVIGRGSRSLDERQVELMISWLRSLKD